MASYFGGMSDHSVVQKPGPIAGSAGNPRLREESVGKEEEREGEREEGGEGGREREEGGEEGREGERK